MGRSTTSVALATLVLSCAASLSVRALEIELRDGRGAPLAFAQVQVVGRAGWSVADADGRFAVEPDPKPPFELLVTDARGVMAKPIRVESLPSSGPLALTVAQGPTESLDVVGAVPDAVLPPAAARAVIGRGDMDARSPRQLADVLGTLPGSGRLEDGASVVPSVRGLARSRTLIVLDDGVVSAERRAGPAATFLDPETLAEVELVRGPGSVAYGSDAFGGVIRARTRLPAPGEPSSWRVVGIGGTNGDGRNLGLEWSGPIAGGGVMVGASWRRDDPYESPEGEVLDSDSESRGARAGWQHALGRGLLSVLWRTDEARNVGKPAADSNVTRSYYPEESSHRLSVGYQTPGAGGWSRFAWSFAWDDYGVVTVRDRRATDTSARRVSTSEVDTNDVVARFEAERPLAGLHLAAGADVKGRYGLRATNLFTVYDAAGGVASALGEVAVDDARRLDAALFGQLSDDGPRIGWSVGGRFDRVTTRNHGGYFGDRSTAEGVLSGFGAATWHVTRRLDLTAQLSRGFRETLLSDRYFRGVSGRGFVTGNPDLEAESSDQYDLAFRWGDRRLRAAVYLFRYEIDDFVERYRSGDDFFFRNRAQATLTGAELEISATLPAAIEILAGLATLRGDVEGDRFVAASRPMADVPPRSALIQVRQRVGSRWSWMVRGAAYRRDDRAGETERPVPGYAVLDVSVARRLSEGLELQLLARNLGDRAYFATADEVGVLAPGRGFELSARGRF